MAQIDSINAQEYSRGGENSGIGGRGTEKTPKVHPKKFRLRGEKMAHFIKGLMNRR